MTPPHNFGGLVLTLVVTIVNDVDLVMARVRHDDVEASYPIWSIGGPSVLGVAS